MREKVAVGLALIIVKRLVAHRGKVDTHLAEVHGRVVNIFNSVGKMRLHIVEQRRAGKGRYGKKDAVCNYDSDAVLTVSSISSVLSPGNPIIMNPLVKILFSTARATTSKNLPIFSRLPVIS